MHCEAEAAVASGVTLFLGRRDHAANLGLMTTLGSLVPGGHGSSMNYVCEPVDQCFECFILLIGGILLFGSGVVGATLGTVLARLVGLASSCGKKGPEFYLLFSLEVGS